MFKYVIDTSVLARLYLNDHNSKKVETLLKLASLSKVKLFAPDLIFYEFASVMIQNLKNQTDVIHTIIQLDLLIESETITIIDKSLLTKKAVEIAYTRTVGHISIYDAYFHAAAFLFDCDFLTLDKKHYNKTKDIIGKVILFDQLDL